MSRQFLFRTSIKAAISALLSASSVQAAVAQQIAVTIDTTEASQVLAALRDPALTIEQALKIAALPGSQGLIRKARDHDPRADSASFARALVAAAHHDTAAPDPSRFRFGDVRDHADVDAATLAGLNDPSTHLLDQVKARVATFPPGGPARSVVGHLVVGGAAGGFAFGDPEFFLNLDFVRSAPLAATIMQHELFHAVQALARDAHPFTGKACVTRMPRGTEVAQFLDALEMEGTASFVGDLTKLPAGVDAASDKEKADFAHILEKVPGSIVQTELSVHGLGTGADASYDDVYSLGFYGDAPLYALGYVMAREIAKEQGDKEIAALSGRPGAEFVVRYTHLKAYGRSTDAPALRMETVRWADRLIACS